MKKVLMIVGSLRRDSFNRQLATRITEMLEGKAETRFLELSDLPFMNQDIEFPPPEVVTSAREAVQKADGVWVVSPEYNHQIPGVLKNLLDWLSRPLIPNDPQHMSAASGKSVTISSVAGSSAGADVRKNLSALFGVMSMNVIGGLGTGISLDAGAFQTNKLTLSDQDKAALTLQVERFLSEI